MPKPLTRIARDALLSGQPDRIRREVYPYINQIINRKIALLENPGQKIKLAPEDREDLVQDAIATLLETKETRPTRLNMTLDRFVKTQIQALVSPTETPRGIIKKGNIETEPLSHAQEAMVEITLAARNAAKHVAKFVEHGTPNQILAPAVTYGWFPGIEPGKTLEEVGSVLGKSRELVRQSVSRSNLRSVFIKTAQQSPDWFSDILLNHPSTLSENPHPALLIFHSELAKLLNLGKNPILPRFEQLI